MEAPFLDHVSLVIGGSRIERLGFALAQTPETADHARVFLRRTYLEVTPASDDGIAARGWFLRRPDLEEAGDLLRAAGLPTRGPERYEGVDGTWLDLAVAVHESPVLPVITMRLDPPAEGWPPATAPAARHPNGATGISALHLRAGTSESILSTMLGALGAGEGKTGFCLADGCRVTVEVAPNEPEGLVGIDFERADAPTLTFSLDPSSGE